MKNNTYFKEMEHETNLTSAQDYALRAWELSVDNNSSIFEVQCRPYCNSTNEFVETLRAAGITEFAVTDQGTGLMNFIHTLEAEGCTMTGLCKVTRTKTRFGKTETTEHDGILFSIKAK